MEKDIKNLYSELQKVNSRQRSVGISKFKEKLTKTMPRWTTKESQLQKKSVKEDIKFLKSRMSDVMTDRLASYGSHDVTNAKWIKQIAESTKELVANAKN